MTTDQRDELLYDSAKTISAIFGKLESMAEDPNYLNPETPEARELFDAAFVAFRVHMAFKSHLRQFTFTTQTP